MFARGANPIWFFNNLTGSTFDDTYWANFLYNTTPFAPQTVYQSPSGTPWSNPIEFQPSGGLPNNIYGDPSGTYRIEIRQGPLSTDPLIYLVQNYVFGDGAGSSTAITDQLLVSENLLTNPQFADTLFGTALTITAAGTYPIVPGWNLILTGSGSTILTQETNAGSSNITQNPAYYLKFINSGWTTAVLEQTFTNNGAIFANGAVSVAFLANTVGSNYTMTVSYVPSTGTATVIHPFVVTPGAFNNYKYAANIGASTNGTTGASATVQLQFALPTSGTLSLSNVQLTGQSAPLSAALAASPATLSPSYQEIPYERMVDHEFNVYRNSLIVQPKNSLLTGWNFALNPWQFKTTTVTNVAANQYTADQTIIIQQAYVAAATANNVAVGQASNAVNYGLQVKAVTATNQFAILQYIAPQTIRQSWGKKVSAMVTLALTTTHGTNNVKVKMRLIYKPGLPSPLSQTDPIASWTVGQDPTSYAASWVPLVCANDPTYTITTTPTSYAFDQFVLPVSTNVDMTLGVLVYTLGGMNQAATADFIVINDVSLVENDFAMPTQRQTFDEVLRQCQYYYEKSYAVGTLPGSSTEPGASVFITPSPGAGIFGTGAFFKVEKNRIPQVGANPNVQWYSPNDGTPDTFYNFATATNIGVDTTPNPGIYPLTGTTNTGFILLTSNPVTLATLTGHWTADSRLGIF